MEYEKLHKSITKDDLNVGDVLVFGSNKNRDSYIITYEVSTGLYYLISLANFYLFDSWKCKESMHKDLVENDKNGYQLIEVIPTDKLELKRIYEKKCQCH